MPQSVPKILLLVCLLAFSISTSSQAETITGAIAESEVFAVSGGGVSSSTRLSVAPDLLKLSGEFELTTSNIGGGSSTGNFVNLTGDYNLQPGQAFSLGYDYNVSLTGGGVVELTTTALTNFNGVEESLTSTETVSESGDFNFSFVDLATFADTAGSGTWSGNFSFNWLNAPSNSRLFIEIPNNSIDFAVTSVPEPNAMGLALAAAVTFVSRRRKSS